MMIDEIRAKLSVQPNPKTKEIDTYNKELIKSKIDVSGLSQHVLDNQEFHRTYFQVSLGQIKDLKAQFAFIEQNEDYLQDWWHVDQLNQFLKKPVDFDFAYDKARQYVNSDKIFTRRWGYVLFLAGLQKDPTRTKLILALMKNDAEYYVQMAQAWLICDLAVFNPKETIEFIENSDLNYNILGKAIQKMVDSFRISAENKDYVKSLRSKLKKN